MAINDIVFLDDPAGTAASRTIGFYSTSNLTIDTIYSVGAYGMAFYAGGITNSTIKNIYLYNCSRGSATSDAYEAIGFYSTGSVVWENIVTEAVRGRTLNFYSAAAAIRFKNCHFGELKPATSADIAIQADTYVDVVFDNCYFNGTNLFNPSYPYTNLAPGSTIKFDKYNRTADNHIFYKYNGIGRATGAGLSDTTVRTAGSLGLRLSSVNIVEPLTYEFKILAIPSKAVFALGFCKKAAGLVGKTATVELWLPGSVAADDTATITDDTEWNPWVVSANYTGTVTTYATVKIKVYSDTETDYLYLDDLYNGTNKIIALDVWEDGMPSPIMFEQLGDAAAVWAVPTSILTTDGTVGKMINTIKNKIGTVIGLLFK